MSPIPEAGLPIKVDFEYGWYAAGVTLRTGGLDLSSCERSCKLVDIHFSRSGIVWLGWPMSMSGVPRIIAEWTDEKIFLDAADAQWIRQEADALERRRAPAFDA